MHNRVHCRLCHFKHQNLSSATSLATAQTGTPLIKHWVMVHYHHMLPEKQYLIIMSPWQADGVIAQHQCVEFLTSNVPPTSVFCYRDVKLVKHGVWTGGCLEYNCDCSHSWLCDADKCCNTIRKNQLQCLCFKKTCDSTIVKNFDHLLKSSMSYATACQSWKISPDFWSLFSVIRVNLLHHRPSLFLYRLFLSRGILVKYDF